MNTRNLKLTLALSFAAGLLVAADDAQLSARAVNVARLIASTGMEFDGIKPAELILQLKAHVESLQAMFDDLSCERVGVDFQLSRLNELEQENAKIEKQKQDILLILQHQSPGRGSVVSSGSSSSSSGSRLQAAPVDVSGIVFGEQEPAGHLPRSNTKRAHREGESSAPRGKRAYRRAGPEDTDWRCALCNLNFTHRNSLYKHKKTQAHKSREQSEHPFELPTAVVRLPSATVHAAIGQPSAAAGNDFR